VQLEGTEGKNKNNTNTVSAPITAGTVSSTAMMIKIFVLRFMPHPLPRFLHLVGFPFK
jgi:hypothetical protein